MDGEKKSAQYVLDQLKLLVEKYGREKITKNFLRRLPLKERGVSYETICAKFGGIVKALNQVDKLLPAKPEEEYVEPEYTDEVVDEHVAVDKKLLEQKTQLKLLDRKYQKLLKERMFQDQLIEVVKDEIRILPAVKIPPKVKPKKGITREEAILCLGDLHIGEVVSAEETGGLGSYDFDVFVTRMECLFEKIIELIADKMQGYDVFKINVLLLGDIISGLIHEELIESALDTVVEWCLGGALIISQFLTDLAQHFEEIDVTGVVGNHGRMHKKPRFKNRYVNWDYLTYQIISLMCLNQKNISFDFPKSFFKLKKIAGQNYLILHGDNIKMYRRIPWYGIETAINELQQLLSDQGEPFRHVILAHFHNLGVLDRVNGEVVLNGSLVGGNEYSLGKLFKSSDPKQMLMGANVKYGPTWRFPINLKYAEKKAKPRYRYESTEPLNEQVRGVIL